MVHAAFVGGLKYFARHELPGGAYSWGVMGKTPKGDDVLVRFSAVHAMKWIDHIIRKIPC